MADVEIAPVESQRTAKEFLEFPYRLYRGEPNWVPPLKIAQKELFDTARHPFYRGAKVARFLARRGNRVTGRVAAILDGRYNEFQNEAAGHFGFLDMEEDQATARALLDAARQWLASQGATVFRGPFNPSTNYECGMLVEGFDLPPMVMMTYNFPYYPKLMEAAGWRKAKDLYAYYTDAAEVRVERARSVIERAGAEGGVRIRPIRMSTFDQDVNAVWKVYNSAWSRNWGFVPMTEEEFRLMAREMKPVLIPELVLLAEADKRVAGFALALPDINQAIRHANGRLFPFGLLKILYYRRTIHKVRVIALGVVPEYRASGLAAGLYAGLMENGVRMGIQGGEFSWVLEDNTLMNRSAVALGGRRYKTYRIYESN